MNEQTRRFNFRFFIGIAAIAMLALLFIGRMQRQNTPALSSADFDPDKSDVAAIPDGLGGVQKGQIAPDFTLLNVDGDEISLSDYAGKGVIVNFWATWCAPCRFEMPEFEAAHEKYEEDGLVILALDQDEAAETVISYFDEEMGLTFTRPLLDENFVIASQYGAFGALPTTVFVLPDGTVERVHRGPLNESLLTQFVEAILP